MSTGAGGEVACDVSSARLSGGQALIAAPAAQARRVERARERAKAKMAAKRPASLSFPVFDPQPRNAPELDRIVGDQDHLARRGLTDRFPHVPDRANTSGARVPELAPMIRDQFAPWLSQIHAVCDAAAFKVALGLGQQADATGFIAARGLALSGDERAAIDQLVAGGHLKRVRGGFRLVTAGPSETPKRAAIVPFPAARRGAYIRKQAAQMAELSLTHADAHLRQQLRLQADTMRRKGVDERTIAREVRSLEAAIRAELWQQALTPDTPRPA